MSYVSLSNIISKESDKQGRATVNYVDEQIKNTFNILNSAGKLGKGFNFNNGKVDIESGINFFNYDSIYLVNTYTIANYLYNKNSKYEGSFIWQSYIPSGYYYNFLTNIKIFGIFGPLNDSHLAFGNKKGIMPEYIRFIWNNTNDPYNSKPYMNLFFSNNVYYFTNLLIARGVFGKTNIKFSLQHVPNLIDAGFMYKNCSNLIGNPVCGPNVIYFDHTYENCINLNGICVCGNNVVNFENCYYSCYKLAGVPICGEKVKNMSFTYYNCKNLRGSGACGDSVEDFRYAYAECTALDGQVKIGKNVINAYAAYRNCISLPDQNCFVYAENIENWCWCFYNMGIGPSTTYKSVNLNLYVISNSKTFNTLVWNGTSTPVISSDASSSIVLTWDNINNYYYNFNYRPKLRIYPRTLEQMKQLDTANWYFNGVHK